MLARRQILPLCTLALLLGGLLGCGNMPQLGGAKTTPIGDVKNSWQKYSTVYLKGQVGKQAPFLGSGAYELEDRTGTILVVTHEPEIAQMCKRVVHLKDGIIIDDKPVDQIRANPDV